MFGSKKTVEETKPAVAKSSLPAADSNALNSLVKGTVVEGIVTSENDIRVDGVIKGTLTCKAKVIIGPSGSIQGDVRCQNAMIEGRFEGKLFVEDLLSVKETAHVVGDITTDKLLVQPGAIFNVTCVMKAAAKAPQKEATSDTAKK